MEGVDGGVDGGAEVEGQDDEDEVIVRCLY
jgi:hypothetical protein